MKLKLKNFTILIGFVILAYILYLIDLKLMLEILKSAKPLPVLLAGVISLLTIILMNIRWARIISICKIKINFLYSLKSLSKGIALGIITPGRIGEFYRAKYLKDINKKSWGMNFSTVVIDRIFDLITLLFLGALCGVILVNNYFVEIPLLLIVGFSISLIFFLILFLNKKNAKNILMPIFNIMVPKKYKKKMNFHFEEFYEGIKKIRTLNYFEGFLYTLGIWFLNVVTFYLISYSLGLNAGFWFIALIAPVMVLLNLIPISVSGLGTVQALSIFFLGLIGASSEQAIAFSFLFIFIGMWIYALPGIVLFILKR